MTPTSGDTLTPPSLPEGLYEDPHKTAAVALALTTNGITDPTIYYPGSSTDVSLARIPGARVLHVDPNLSPEDVKAMQSMGLEAMPADAYTFQPDTPVDALCFFSPSGINMDRVLDNTTLSPQGIITWERGGTDRPWALQERPDLELIGAIPRSEDGQLTLLTNNLDAYFQRKPYAELTPEEQTTLHSKISLPENTTWDEIYEHIQDPRFSNQVFEAGIVFPYKNNEPALFIYRKRPQSPETTQG